MGKKKSLVYEQRIFNYRLSYARRIVENALGLLERRWHLYNKPLEMGMCTYKKRSACYMYSTQPYPVYVHTIWHYGGSGKNTTRFA